MPASVRQLIPVVVSIAIILVVAYLRNVDKRLAAIFATMPINLPLALWIVAGTDDITQEKMVAYAGSLAVGIVPTVLFTIVAWLGLRAGWTVWGAIGAGYVSWGLLLVTLIAVRGGL